MAYCKHCPCGNVLIYENMGQSPLRCPKCTRFIAAFKEEIYQEPAAEQVPPTPAATPSEPVPQPEAATQQESTQPEAPAQETLPPPINIPPIDPSLGGIIPGEFTLEVPAPAPRVYRTDVQEAVEPQPEDTPAPEPPAPEPPAPEPPAPEPPAPEVIPEIPPRKRFLITLETPDGELVLPVTEKMDVGRNACGKEYLGQFPDVTRTHFTIAPRSNGITATLTDHGRWGTFVNGTRMIKESSVVVSNYTEIRLASKAILLIRVKEVTEND